MLAKHTQKIGKLEIFFSLQFVFSQIVELKFPGGSRITFQITKFTVFLYARVFYVAALEVAAAEKESYEKVGGEEEISS